MFSYSPNFYQERLQGLVVRRISICRAVIRHLQGSKLTLDMIVMKAVTAWCCRVRSAAPEIQFPTEQRGSILHSFLLYPLNKIFSHLQNKKVRNNVFVYKNRFLARQIGPVMAFIPDNNFVHVHLLEDNDPIKNKDGCCQLGFSVSLIFHKNNKSVSAKIITGLSRQFRSGDNIFSVQIATTTVCITRKMHLYRHLSRFFGRSLDFSSV